MSIYFSAASKKCVAFVEKSKRLTERIVCLGFCNKLLPWRNVTTKLGGVFRWIRRELKLEKFEEHSEESKWLCGAGLLGCWGVGLLGCCGVAVLGCWGVGVLGCWGVGLLGCKGKGKGKYYSHNLQICIRIRGFAPYIKGLRPLNSVRLL